jgi:uncharacterized protein (TIGR02594 family)
MIQISAFKLAQRFIGVKEIQGTSSNPLILAMLKLDDPWPQDDEVAWCSAFMNFVCWLLSLPRSKKLNARSWLAIGTPIQLDQAVTDCDVVIIKRGEEPQPGPEILDAAGHVGLFAGIQGDSVLLLAGNQGNAVSIAAFPADRILGIRRLA